MNICVFGDSVTYAGYIKNSWANLLRWHLEETADDLKFYNMGINGDTSANILSRFKCDAASREPNKVIFAFGINDSAYFFATNEPLVDEKAFETNVEELIKQAKEFTSDITFVGLALGDDSLLKPYSESSKGKSYDQVRVKRYDEIIKTIAAANACKYIYLFDKLEFSDFDDGLHPNESGHQKMFKVIRTNL